MVLLSLAFVLLSVSPLVVTLLHVLFGLKWRANSLLGRLDTVIELNALDDRNLAIKTNLENQLTEMYYLVWGFASKEKYQEMAVIHRRKKTDLAVFDAIYGRSAWPSKDSKSADSKDGDSGESNDGKSAKGKHSKSADSQDSNTEMVFQRRSLFANLRYHLPAGFLCIIYLLGFLMVLVWYQVRASAVKPAPAAAAQASVVQTANAPPVAGSAPASGPNRRRASRDAAKPGQDTPDPKGSQATVSAAQNAAPSSAGNPATAPAQIASRPTASGQVAAAPVGYEKPPWDQRVADWFQKFLTLFASIGSTCSSLWTACTGGGLNPPSYLIYTFLGGFVFNTGIMVRRIFVWDISGQMFWWAAYRVILSLGLAGVLHFTLANDKLDAHYYFLIAPASVAVFDQLIRNLRAKLLQSEAAPKRNELSLQLVQGVDYWKEQRLLEEGIESVQHLATADFVTLALFTRSPLFTIMDWVDQAIFIQRFPGKADKMADAGLPVSAVELAWGWDPANRARFESRRTPATAGSAGNGAATDSYPEYLQLLADATGAKPGVIARTLDAWSNDNQVQMLTLFWRADLGGQAAAQSNEAADAE
jgi:hypothetical protein